jgi:hypothetical protein
VQLHDVVTSSYIACHDVATSSSIACHDAATSSFPICANLPHQDKDTIATKSVYDSISLTLNSVNTAAKDVECQILHI